MTFETPITLSGPFRSPRQMLDAQSYDGHTSVHDDQTAEALGLAGAPIEGPTHFSQFDPLAVSMWGREWFERGRISAHFKTMVVDGEEVRASATPTAPRAAHIEAVKRDGPEVLTGTMSLGHASPGHDSPLTELDQRRSRLGDPGELFIIDQLEIGQRTATPVTVAMSYLEPNGSLYPFSLAQKLDHITESTPWYIPDHALDSPWGRAIVPTEMISVLVNKAGGSFAVRGPAVGLFIDLEIRLHPGPVFVDAEYILEREIVGLGQSRRVESYWTETSVRDADRGDLVATVVLHQGVFKQSYAGYPADKLG